MFIPDSDLFPHPGSRIWIRNTAPEQFYSYATLFWKSEVVL